MARPDLSRTAPIVTLTVIHVGDGQYRATACSRFASVTDTSVRACPIDRSGAAPVARRFAAHLAVEFPAVFTFLLEPDAIDATNWRAEQALGIVYQSGGRAPVTTTVDSARSSASGIRKQHPEARQDRPSGQTVPSHRRRKWARSRPSNTATNPRCLTTIRRITPDTTVVDRAVCTQTDGRTM